MGRGHKSDRCSPCFGVKFHSLMEVSTGSIFEHLFIATILVSSSSESSESSDSDASSKFRDPATLRSQGFIGLKPTDPMASKLDVSVYSCMKAGLNSTLMRGVF